jgi:hypothetical protein
MLEISFEGEKGVAVLGWIRNFEIRNFVTKINFVFCETSILFQKISRNFGPCFANFTKEK